MVTVGQELHIIVRTTGSVVRNMDGIEMIVELAVENYISTIYLSIHLSQE